MKLFLFFIYAPVPCVWLPIHISLPCVGLNVPQGLQAIHHMCILLPTTTAVLVSLVSDDA